MNAGPLNTLFFDHVHPNDRGYDIISATFFEAITRAAGGSASGLASGFLDLDASAGLPGFHALGPRASRPEPVSREPAPRRRQR